MSGKESLFGKQETLNLAFRKAAARGLVDRMEELRAQGADMFSANIAGVTAYGAAKLNNQVGAMDYLHDALSALFILDAFQQAKEKAGENIAPGLKADGKKLVFVVTDGQENGESAEAIKELLSEGQPVSCGFGKGGQGNPVAPYKLEPASQPVPRINPNVGP